MKHPFWRAFSWTLGVYLLGIALAVWVIEPPGAPAGEPVREAVQYSPDPEEDLILLGRVEGEEPVALLLGFFPAQQRVAALALTGEELGSTTQLRQALEQQYGLTIDGTLSGPPESWQRLVQGLGASTLTLEQDSTVLLGSEPVILRAGRQRLDSRLSLALLQSGSGHAGELAAAWCRQFCQGAEMLGSEELFARLSGGFSVDFGYAGIARHLQGLVWLGQQETAAQTADPADRAGARALFARSKGTKHPDLSISDKTGPR